MRRRRVVIPTLGAIRADPDLPSWLAHELARTMDLEAVPGPQIGLHESWRDQESARYDSNRIIDALVGALPGEWQEPDTHGLAWTLALTEADLRAPGRPFVFGEATLGGPCAVVSLARLRSPDRDVLRLRALKEAAHEIGHLAGLEHCTDPRCVMFPSADLPDTDAKREHLCDACRAGPHRPPPP